MTFCLQNGAKLEVFHLFNSCLTFCKFRLEGLRVVVQRNSFKVNEPKNERHYLFISSGTLVSVRDIGTQSVGTEF